MSASSHDVDNSPVNWYGSDAPAPSSRTSMFRSVLIIINYFPSIADIQAYGHTNVIDNAIREPPFGNPWLLRHVIFTIGETIRSDLIIHTRFSDVHETLTNKVYDTWGIRLPETFFTFRFKDSHGQTHDIPLGTNLYWMLVLHLAGWNRAQHTGDNSAIPFVAGLTQPYILRLTAHRSS